jgi:ABC-2 type transport system ATP-binding protein
MISVRNLTRRYGNVTAVNDISFEVPQGQIVGFLGPNGAGKTTTIRVLTGFLAPSEGEVFISSLNLEENLTEIKKIIGYVAEDNPLYEDMSVFDYLLWSGKLKGLKNKELIDAVKNAVQTCSISDVVTKQIGHLSKGYRKRTAIANAILHNPKILFLDEPTSGLDPNQASEMRTLIKTLGRGKTDTECRTRVNGCLDEGKTIIISTHILTEAKEVCDRIIIMNKGKIAAEGDTKSLLSAHQNEQKIALITEKSINPQELEQKLSVFGKCQFNNLQNEYEFIIESQRTDDFRKDIFNFIVQNKIPVLEFKKENISLEELFKQLTL